MSYNIENIVHSFLTNLNLDESNFTMAYNFIEKYINDNIDDVNTNMLKTESYVLNKCVEQYKSIIEEYNLYICNMPYLSDDNIMDIYRKISMYCDYGVENIFALKSLIHINAKLLLMENMAYSELTTQEFNKMVIERCKKLLNI